MTTRRIVLAAQGRSSGRPPRDDTGATALRMHLFDDLFAKRYDEAVLDSAPPWTIRAPLPRWVKLATELRRRRDEYDVVVTWSERLSLAVMTLDRLLGPAKPHIVMSYWFSRPSFRATMLACGDSLHAIITWSSVQRAFAVERLGIAPEKIYLVRHFVDQLFWTAQDRETDMICSAGAEMRDFPTLIEAMRGTDIPCHIATDHVRVDRFGFGRRVSASKFSAGASGNVTIGRKSSLELRDLYARSRFVVVPLRATDTDNGVNVILESMAMGKPVICSRTRGQVDVIEEGVTGLFVPVGDVAALRGAIQALWSDPRRCRAMGRAARAYVEKHHKLETFCRDVKSAIDASLDGRAATPDGAISSETRAPATEAPRAAAALRRPPS